MSIQSLLNTLEQKVQQLTQAYQTDSDKKINAKFNRTLFTEDFETVGFYLKENGFFLLLISFLTGLDEVILEMGKNGFSAKIVGKEKCSFEELIVLKGEF